MLSQEDSLSNPLSITELRGLGLDLPADLNPFISHASLFTVRSRRASHSSSVQRSRVWSAARPPALSALGQSL